MFGLLFGKVFRALTDSAGRSSLVIWYMCQLGIWKRASARTDSLKTSTIEMLSKQGLSF